MGPPYPTQLREDLGYDGLIWKGLKLSAGDARYALGFAKEKSDSPSLARALGIIEIPFVIPYPATSTSPQLEIPSIAFSGVGLDTELNIHAIGARYFLREQFGQVLVSVSIPPTEFPPVEYPRDSGMLAIHTARIPEKYTPIFPTVAIPAWRTGGLITPAMVEQTDGHERSLVFLKYRSTDQPARNSYAWPNFTSYITNDDWVISHLKAQSWEFRVPRSL